MPRPNQHARVIAPFVANPAPVVASASRQTPLSAAAVDAILALLHYRVSTDESLSGLFDAPAEFRLRERQRRFLALARNPWMCFDRGDLQPGLVIAPADLQPAQRSGLLRHLETTLRLCGIRESERRPILDQARLALNER